MESEVLSGKIERDTRRMLAAFGVENVIFWEQDESLFFAGDCEGERINWDFNIHTGKLIRLEQGTFGDGVVKFNPFSAYLNPDEGANVELFARAFYRLGFDEEAVLAQLPLLSAHEKIGLRLTFPREFWPKQWIEEEAK